jgi:dinuclear metal center YbgI/SA1388 family protein
MQLSEVVAELDRIAPLADAESWDNVGLLVGDPKQSVTRALVCIDYTPAVAAEASAAGCELVIAYHPPLFKPLTRVVAGGASALVFDAARRGVAIYSPHTALDVADGGTNDVLADLLGLQDRRPLRIAERRGTQHKLVTFVPRDQVERVSEALFEAGAGQIGEYARCSFRTDGVGTFLGEDGTHPAAGEAGQFERVPEVKIETVVPEPCVARVLAALRATHPYEEPAFDLQQLAAPPTGRGIGRVGTLARPIERAAFLPEIKRALNVPHLLAAGVWDGPACRVAVCAGAGDDLLDAALSHKADVYVTGELRHHDALKAAAHGMAVACTLHSNSERVALPALIEKLTQALPGLTVRLAAADVEPFAVQ